MRSGVVNVAGGFWVYFTMTHIYRTRGAAHLDCTILHGAVKE